MGGGGGGGGGGLLSAGRAAEPLFAGDAFDDIGRASRIRIDGNGNNEENAKVLEIAVLD